ncbi:YciI family protein [Nodosilinea nodulosa]|uniref:YciI family protein n=1 Tax=Nodosilinea nodulosa TaxID=416001 RepID=UPI000300A6EE|nr:YciI family protein [Nodosilinea nodulosa]
MKFICLGYFDENQWDRLSEAEQSTMMEDCFAYDDELRRGGHFVGGEALQSVKNAATLRYQNGQVMVTDGPYAETKEYLGGILILEARDLNHAIQLMSQHPGVRNGPFEIRPVDEDMNALVAEREKSFQAAKAMI